MMGTAANDWAGAFWRADVDEAAGALLDVIMQVRPQVLVTYDSNGFYGHPDHIQAHRVAWRAFELSDGIVRKFYATAVPKSVLAEGIRLMREAPDGAQDAAKGLGSEFQTVESVDDLPFGVPDEEVTTEIDASDYLDAKLTAMRAHASQIAVDSPFFALSDRVGQRAFGVEYYTLLAGPRGEGHGSRGRESDLFAGLG
jgi:N-acetyl-1-D-myo-inositol-2-amino-2-deoxy-alpha-D-glucopyranoside deacetylase